MRTIGEKEMTEIERFKTAVQQDKKLHSTYLRMLDSLMTDGDITPEMAAQAAQKLGFDIKPEELAQGASEGSECVTAPDGKTIGCPYEYYLTWTDYWIRNEQGLCPCGGKHELDDNSVGKVCRKCRLALDERGVVECYDGSGRAVPH